MFSQFLKLMGDATPQALSNPQTEQVYIFVLGHLSEKLRSNPEYVQVMKRLAALVLERLKPSPDGSGAIVIRPDEIMQLLSSVGVEPITERGTPGIDRCALYLKQFGIPVSATLSSSQVTVTRGFFGQLVVQWSEGWRRHRDAIYGNNGRAENRKNR